MSSHSILLVIGLWCNGSTTGFGSVCPGSNPGGPTTNYDFNMLMSLLLIRPYY